MEDLKAYLGRMYSADAVYGWIRQGKLQVERISGNIRSVGKYPYYVERAQLKSFLQEMHFDFDSIFPENE